jgi:DNA-binding transcriptional regulator GbsR (MarR family)
MRSSLPRADSGGARVSAVTAEDRFIGAWGQMGSTWGVSRTMAEVHALLFITGRPLCTDEVMQRLEISRGNASMSLRALLDWGIVARVHKRGDRKEYFEAEQDPWRIVQLVVRERMKREVHPVLAALAELRDAAGDSSGDHSARLDAMLDLLQVMDQLGERFVEATPDRLRDTAAALSLLPPGEPVQTRSARSAGGQR